MYENWTDVSGVLAADPRVIAAPPPIATMTYAEVRELAYLGATVLTRTPFTRLRPPGIPIHICNTMDPQAPGTWIVAQATEPAGGHHRPGRPAGLLRPSGGKGAVQQRGGLLPENSVLPGEKRRAI